MKNKKIKILHAPAIVTHQQWTVSRAQRELGYVSDVMVFNADQPNQPQHDCDINLHFDRNMCVFNPLKPISFTKTVLFIFRFTFFFLKAIIKYDVFHFHSESFLGSYSDLDLRILRFLRKKMVFQYWGCDIRLKSIFILDNEYSTCDDCIRICQNSRKQRDMDMHLKYSDFRVYGGGDSIRGVPDALFVPICIDTRVWKQVSFDDIPEEHRLPKTHSVRIMQAFQNWKTRGDQKGTKYIKAAIDDLKKEGFDVEHMFVDNVPNKAMKYYYQQSDIVVDALLNGWYQNVAIEGMAMARPVICHLKEEYRRLIPGEMPIIDATPENLKEVLKELIADKAKRETIGQKSRAYIEEYYDSRKIARQWIDLYEKKWQ